MKVNLEFVFKERPGDSLLLGAMKVDLLLLLLGVEGAQ